MIFKGLKNRALKKGFEAELKKRKPSGGIKQLKTLAVLIDASNGVNILSLVKVADELGVKSANLKVIAYKKDYNEKEGHVGEANYFNDKGVGNTGSFKSGLLQEFVSKEYDVLINFYTENHALINYVAAASKAKFKIGFGEVDNRINDLVIESVKGNTNIFIAELKKYLKILNII